MSRVLKRFEDLNRPKQTNIPARARHYGKEMLDVLIEIARDDAAANRDRIQAASTVIARGYGTAPAKIELGIESRYQQLLDEGVEFTAWPTDALMALLLDLGASKKGMPVPEGLAPAVARALELAASRAGQEWQDAERVEESDPGQVEEGGRKLEW